MASCLSNISKESLPAAGLGDSSREGVGVKKPVRVTRGVREICFLETLNQKSTIFAGVEVDLEREPREKQQREVSIS